MPVFNAQDYLCESIESILNQTFKDFEFIIVDDASTDSSWSILQRYAKMDKRIKLFQNKENLKQGATVTVALKQAKGQYIARMDADDVAMKNRFALQIKHLEANKKTVAVGSQCRLIDRNGKNIGTKTFPLAHNKIYKYIMEFCPVQQPAMIFAVKRLPHDFSFYDHGMSPVEDVELLMKLFKYGNVENSPDFLLKYRIHGQNSSLLNLKRSFYLTFLSRMRGIILHGYKPTIKGLAVTLAQFVVVMTLPQDATYALYRALKRIKQTTKETGLKPALTFVPSFYRYAASFVPFL